jgi:hypothetical protein
VTSGPARAADEPQAQDQVAAELPSAAAILVNRSATPLPKTLGWYSLLVGVLAIVGPLGFLDFLFGFPTWLIATAFVIATKVRRSTLGPSSESADAAGSPARQLVTT